MNRVYSALPHKTNPVHHAYQAMLAFAVALACLCLCAICSLPLRSALAETSNSDQACSLTIESVYNQQALPNMNVSLYKVATLSGNNWSYTGNYSTCTISLEGLEKASEWDAAAKELDKWTTKHSLPFVANATTNANGEAFFDNLSQGLYLVSGATTTLDGKTYTQAPFLVSLPSTDEISGSTIYDVVSEPKKEQSDSNITSSPSEANTHSPDANNADSSQKTSDYTFLLIGGIALLIVVCIAVLVIARRKK